jgi:membrane protein implicated in regulation of membrane protease activity
LWLAAAGFITGAVVWLFLITFNAQLFVFSILSIAAIGLWKIVGYKKLQKTDHPLLNKRGQQYIGRTFNLGSIWVLRSFQ